MFKSKYFNDSEHTFSPDDFEAIEKEMRKICKEKLKLERFELPREEAIKYMQEKDEPYKVCLLYTSPSGSPPHLLLTAVILRQPAANPTPPYQAARSQKLMR